MTLLNVEHLRQTIIFSCVFTIIVTGVMNFEYGQMNIERQKKPEPVYMEELQNYRSTQISSEDVKVELPAANTMMQRTKDPVKVLLVTTARSGSSYLGALLASNNNTLYFFEPSRKGRLPLNEFLKMVEGLFFCDADAYEFKRKYRDQFDDKLGRDVETCKNADMIVIKTIRLRFHSSMAFLRANPDVKVIFLVRDPRGRMASLLTAWERRANRTKLYMKECMATREDLSPFSQLPKQRKLFLKYEDLVRKPLEAINTLANYLNLLSQTRMISFIKNHYSNITHKGAYFGHSQPEDYDPNHKWKMLPKEQLLEIETICRDVMKSLGYIT